jgi:hypothetical protein
VNNLYVELDPPYLDLAVGETAEITVTITNSGVAIDGYKIRVFGLDTSWVTVSPARVAVFPGETARGTVTIKLPQDYPSGPRLFTIQVHSETDTDEFALAPLTVVVATDPRIRLRAEPSSVVGGKKATFTLVVVNEGNTPVVAVPDGVDPEEVCTFDFKPTTMDVNPGRRETAEVRVVGQRPWFGMPAARILTFGVATPERSETVVSFVQKPRIGRGLLSLLGLIIAAAIFAGVLSRTFDTVVEQASVDPKLLDQALDKGEAGGAKVPLKPLAISGKVTSRTTQQGIAGVQADLYLDGSFVTPLYTAATADDGAYSFGRLAAGKYVLRFSGAGFGDLWYPDGSTVKDAKAVELKPGAPLALDDVEIGGRPGSIAGIVIIGDPKGVTATLFLPGQIDEGTSALVQKVKVGADGSFAFANVASPNTYQLLIEKPGFAPDERTIVLGPAQDLTGIEVTLRSGNGRISGTISSSDGPLGAVIVEATDGTTKVTTASLTEGAVGTYVLRGLPTPGVYTVTVRLPGFEGASRTIALGAEQQVEGVAFSLSRATGTIRGTVSQAGVGPLGGVTVTVTGGDTTVTTTSISQGDSVGTYLVEGLPIPATYTVSFSALGLASQVRLQDLDPHNGSADVTGVDATLAPATAIVRGTVRDAGSNLVALSTVVLNDGTKSRTLLTANDPIGAFEFSDVAPGTYTLTATLPGTTPSVVLVNVFGADVRVVDITLTPQASISGKVFKANGITPVAAWVRIFKPSDFPGTPQQALATIYADGLDPVHSPALGVFNFTSLDAPADYVVAVYASDLDINALDSRVIQNLTPGVDTPLATNFAVPL